MDYAFCPNLENDPGDMDYQILFQRAANIILIEKDQIKHEEICHLAGFLEELWNLTEPPGDLWIGCHGSRSGMMSIALDYSFFSNSKKKISQVKETSYEGIEDVIRSGSILLPIVLWQLQQPGGSIEPPTIHIRACGVGAASPFLKKLKEAFKYAKSITSPLHILSILPRWYGSFEWLNRRFMVFQKDGYKSNQRSDLISAFMAKDDIFIGDEHVPKELFEKWVYKDVNKKKCPISYPVTFAKNVGKNKRAPQDICEGEYRHKKARYYYYVRDVESDTTEDERFQLMMTDMQLNKRGYFNSDHEFPVYERYGYNSFKEFLVGWDWNLKNYDEKNKVLCCEGCRHEYSIDIPITRSLIDKTLYFNFYPSQKGIEKGYKQVSDMDENNLDLFNTE